MSTRFVVRRDDLRRTRWEDNPPIVLAVETTYTALLDGTVPAQEGHIQSVSAHRR